ncbi:MAG: AmmeMemoRadiSam system protein A [Epsilonproteobacteria bacterium]|nr:AmmeMemoRadiSam system protein A [Campylobacterota bacterium]
MNGSLYLMIAREAILSTFQHTEFDVERLKKNYPELTRSGATFVTLTENNRLRGCIGSLVAHRSLIDDLISNARSAAFRDPRFKPLAPEEIDQIRVEVSLLTPPQKVEYTSIDELRTLIRPQVDGVILRLGNHQATFLPQVWEDLDDFDEFFAHLGHKAGLGSDPLSYEPEIYTYQVEKFKEA